MKQYFQFFCALFALLWKSSDPIIPDSVKRFFINLLTHGFCTNYWVWFHILAGGAGAKLLMIAFRFKPLHAFLIVVGCAVIWEICELGIDDVKKVYGSWSRWAFDSTGDILGAAIAAAIVVL